MRDRLPQPGKEGRVKITQDNGQVIEGVLDFADGATQAGSAYSKGNVLPDSVCDALGIDMVTSEPKDAFGELAGRITPFNAYATDLYLYITGKHPILSAGRYSDHWKIELMARRSELSRNVALSGNAETITLYDGGSL